MLVHIFIKPILKSLYLIIFLPVVETSEDFQKAWEVIRNIMIRLNNLTEQWQGLYLTVHSPCKSSDCDEYFEWNDWQEWLEDSGTSKFNM